MNVPSVFSRKDALTTRIGSYDDVRRIARRRLPRGVFEFVDGGAGGEVTLRENRAAFERVRFDPQSAGRPGRDHAV
jgi:hypothetical protein